MLFHHNSSIEYIESLRLETGIPNFCLREDRNVSTLIKKYFQLLQSFQVSDEEKFEFIKADAAKLNIPLVLQQDTFYKLVEEVVHTFLNFKLQYKLGNTNNPLGT